MMDHLCHVLLNPAFHDQCIGILKSAFPGTSHAEQSIFSKGQQIWLYIDSILGLVV
jgi:hypothetical protein